MDIAASASAGGGGGPGGGADVHPSREKYDVFISFRGEDTRNTFTSHLHGALLQKKIETYIDYRLVRGSEIAPALLEAIEKSTLSLVIFSQNYASSTWCLDELAHILNCRETVDQMVIPIFYDISPSDVRKQQGTYADAFAQLEIRFKDSIDKVHKWRAALVTVANLSGFDYSNKTGTEADLVKKVVDEIWGKLNQKSSSNLKGLVGMERRIDQVESTLCIDSLDVYAVGIWGMGGIGKTTLADAVFHRFSSKFEASCFLKNVREISEQTGGLDRLRNTLVSEILKEKDLNIGTLTIGSYLVRKRMGGTKVLIVLDDINDSNQLNFPAGDPTLFGPGSRIIITTRDKSLLQKLVDHNKICKVQELNSDEALQLFRLCAFGNNISRVDCTELSKVVVDYCGGIPLALQILGSSFLHCESKEDWLDEWKEFPREKIWKVFRSSYDGLKEIEKEIFLDIACFYQGKDVDIVKEMLDICGFRAAGIEVLSDKSLISISTNNCLEMHNLLQEMGRAIVHEQCIEEPIKCNRLFFDEDVNRDLKTNTGSATVQAIFFNRSKITGILLNHADFEKMYDLRLLYVYNSSCNKYCKVKVSLPHSLTYLGWEGYPFKSLPSKLCPENLVELQMRNSQVEQLWNEGQNLKNLKVMDLRLSEHLIKVPDLSQSPNIEHIDLYGCKSLVEIPSYFPCLDKLSYLNLTDCTKLKYLSEMPSSIEYLYLDSTAIEELPSSVWSFEKIRCLELPNNIPILDLSGNATNCKILVSLLESICKLKSLKSLDLSGTTVRSLPASIGNLESLEKLDLSGTAIRSLPASIGNLASLEKLDLSGTAVKSLPASIGNLESLEKLDLSGTTIKSLPASIGNLKSLVKLYLSGTAIEGLPASIGNLKSLKKLDLSETAIESLPASIGNLESLENLDLSGTAIKSLHASIGKLQYLQKFYLSGTAMESLPASIGNLKCLDKLDLSETAIKSLPASIGSLRSLEKLDLSGTAIESLPSSIGSLKSLENLDLSGTAIESLPASFDNLNSLVKLDLSGTAFKSLPASIGNLKSLEKLDLSGTAIESLPASIGNLKSLEKLDLSGTTVESLPASIGNLESLEKLDLSGTAIKSLPASIGNLECLEKLDLSGTAIESLPASIGNLESLKKLDLSGTAIESLPARIGNLKSLEKLDLSGTAIKTLPACIGNLKSLEKLDLSGTAIKCLPASIKEASRLISLRLTNCRSLESLPELPGVRWLEAHGCTSLNKVLSSRTALSLGWDEYKHSQGLQEQLTFSNCIGMGGDAWRDILTDSQIRIMRMATALSKYFTQEEIEVAFHLEFEEESNEYVFRSPVCIVCPGSTIPRWFPNEVDNSALAINLGSNFFNTSFLGFAYSVVVAFENYNVGGSLSLGCKINFKGCGDPFIYHRSCMVADYGEINDCKFDTPHVFVWFSSFDHVKQGSYNGVTEAIFDFYPIIEDRPDDGAVDCSNIKVTKCGIFPLYAPNDSALK